MTRLRRRRSFSVTWLFPRQAHSACVSALSPPLFNHPMVARWKSTTWRNRGARELASRDTAFPARGLLLSFPSFLFGEKREPHGASRIPPPEDSPGRPEQLHKAPGQALMARYNPTVDGRSRVRSVLRLVVVLRPPRHPGRASPGERIVGEAGRRRK